MRFFGVEASVHDVIVTTNSGPVAVYEGCSGVRSMFFLFGLAFLLLIIFPPKGVLTGLATLVAAVAIAFIVNAFRVALLIQLVSAANRGAFEFWHKGDGALLFESGSVFIFILLYRFLVLGGANEKQDWGAMSHWVRIRIAILVLLGCGSAVVLGRSLVTRAPLDPSFPAFSFPHDAPLPDWQADESFPLPKSDVEKADNAVKAGSYNAGDSLEVQLRFIADTHTLHVADPLLQERMLPAGFLPLDVGLHFLVDYDRKSKKELQSRFFDEWHRRSDGGRPRGILQVSGRMAVASIYPQS